MRRLILIFSGAFLVIGFVALTVSKRAARRGLDAMEASKLSEAQLERYIEDQRRLAALDLVPATRGTCDAGEVLNRWVALDGGTDQERAPDEDAWWADPAVAVALKCKEKTGDGEPAWLACAAYAPTGDLSFMSALLAYDTWDPSSSGAWRRYLDAHPREAALTAAIPNYVPLQTLVKLRLIAGLRDGDPLTALREVRHFARLTWSTETLIGAMVAVAMLNVERAGYEAAVAQGLLAPEAWRPMSAEEAEIFKRVLWTSQGLYMGLGPPDAIARLHAAVPDPIDRCPAGAEAAVQLRLLRALFTQTWPGEVDLRERLRAVDARMSDGRCRDVFVGALWADPSRDLDLFDTYGLDGQPLGEDPSARWVRWAVATPWVRQAIGGVLLAVASPDLNRYDE